MTSITSWSRLELRSRSDDMEKSLQARIHDPLWLLARQWQMGEFAAEDAGSPVSVRIRADVGRLTRYHSGLPAGDTMVTGTDLRNEELPLEVLVEREPLHLPNSAGPAPLVAAETGLRFVQLLEAHGVPHLRDPFVDDDRYGFDLNDFADAPGMDAASRRFCTVMHGRVPDGMKLHAQFRNLANEGAPIDTLLPEEITTPNELEATIQAITEWVSDYKQLFAQPSKGAPSAWNPARMEYAFSVAAPLPPHEVVLSASEFRGGHLDWFNFDIVPKASLGASADFGADHEFVDTVVPSPVTFHGMPASRWWEIEDPTVNYAQIDAGPLDLLHPIFLHFAIDYGDDWFVIPIDLDVGSLIRTRSLVVTDSFGVRTLVPHYSHIDTKQEWRMYDLGPADQSATDIGVPAFFLPPALIGSLNGSPVEEIAFLRDEMANLVWAVEKTIENGIGRAYGRDVTSQESSSGDPAANSNQGNKQLHYKLATQVPDHWIPFVPQTLEDGYSVRLKRAKMWTDALEGQTRPQGHILRAESEMFMYEEEVPRQGIQVTRNYQYTRWFKGMPLLWLSRLKGPGRGEGWSGLLFDQVEL